MDALSALGRSVSFVRGNADRELVERPEAGAARDLWQERARWASERLTRAQRDLLESLPETVRFDIEGLGATLFCHGSPRSDEEIITRITSENRLLEIIGGVKEKTVVCGHTHVQFDRTVGGTRVVNAGSVGMPYEGAPGAYWALFGADVELRRTVFDFVEAAERIRQSGWPGADELVAENVLASPSADEASELFERMALERAPDNER
jgi:predicted phosphodiesterase